MIKTRMAEIKASAAGDTKMENGASNELGANLFSSAARQEARLEAFPFRQVAEAKLPAEPGMFKNRFATR
jgi:hypothetical protein